MLELGRQDIPQHLPYEQLIDIISAIIVISKLKAISVKCCVISKIINLALIIVESTIIAFKIKAKPSLVIPPQ